MVDEHALLAAGSCSVEAPAGCGKTELIARALKISTDNKRYLVLTHTHAGVRVLRSRLRRLQVPSGRARIDTIASWSLGYALSYPKAANWSNGTPTDDEWDDVYRSVLRLLKIPAIQRVIRASYAGVFIDEYQDCTEDQHHIAVALSKLLDCKVLGDPLQSIFHFRGAKVGWKSHVEKSFPPLGQLTEPWRWKNRNEALGGWLLQIRETLKTGGMIDLASAPLKWVTSTTQNQIKVAKELLGADGDVVAIRKRKESAHKFASLCKGYSSMEEMQCNTLLEFAAALDQATGPARALAVVEFSTNCATGIKPFLRSELRKLKSGELLDESRGTSRDRKNVASSLNLVCTANDIASIEQALGVLLRLPKVRIYRWELIYAARDAFKTFKTASFESVHEAAWTSRNTSRHSSRKLARRLVSRTLLIKGLEFEHAIVADADEFTGSDGAQNFYVAASRGSSSLAVLSRSSTLIFPKPDL